MNCWRVFLIETRGGGVGHCGTFLALGALVPFFPERIFKMKDGLFVRNSFALVPSCKELPSAVAQRILLQGVIYIDIGDRSPVCGACFLEIWSKNLPGDQVVEHAF